ncbi:MAG: TraB/GumN family protein, partial [Burkholderiaceae bacterium]
MNLCAVALRALCVAAALATAAIPPGRAQSPGAEAARTVEAADSRGFAWEATKNGRRVLLVGTIHVGRAAAPPPDCGDRYAQAAVIAFEANVFDAQKVGALVQKLATYPSHEPDLKSRLPAPLRERVQAVLVRYGLDSPAIWRMKPWMLANTLVVVEAARLGFNPAHSTEA